MLHINSNMKHTQKTHRKKKKKKRFLQKKKKIWAGPRNYEEVPFFKFMFAT